MRTLRAVSYTHLDVYKRQELHIPKEMITEVLDEMGLSASVRGEALTLEQFAELSNRILEKRKNA